VLYSAKLEYDGDEEEKYYPKQYNNIKQFVVTNCSKERPGSIVNETLKNGILILKDTPKELDLHADFKFISFVLLIKSYGPEKICLILENRGKLPLKVIENPIVKVSSSYL